MLSLFYLAAIVVPPVLAFKGKLYRGAWFGVSGAGLLLAALGGFGFCLCLCFGGFFAGCFYRKAK